MSAVNDKKDSIYISAKVLLDNIDQHILDYYNDKIANQPLSNYLYEEMKEWFMEKSNTLKDDFVCEPSLLNIIYYIIETSSLQMGDTKAAYSFYQENKRNRKNYMYGVIKKEYEGKPTPKNPLYLKHKADTYFELLLVSPKLTKYDSKEQYITKLFEEITEWKNNKNASLFDFMFFERLDDKRKAGCFLFEIGENIFRIITEEFYGKIDGGVTSFPTELFDGVFSLRKENLDLEIELNDNKAFSKSESILKDESGNQVTVTTIYDELERDFSTLSEEEKTAMIDKLRLDNELVLQAKSLSAQDLVVLTNVYSYLNAQVLNENFFSVNGTQFVQQVLGRKKLRLRDKKHVIDSLNRLAQADIKFTRTNSKGVVDYVGNFSFFDITYGNTSNDVDSSYDYTVNSDNDKMKEIDDSILSSDKWTINFFPSQYLKEQWSKNVTAEIYTKQFQQIPDAKPKSYMLLLEDERLKKYPEMSVFLSYAYLKNKIKMDTMRPVHMKKEISEHLTTLKDHNIVVESFQFSATGVFVNFLPFTTLEKELYGIDNKNIPSENMIINKDGQYSLPL